MSCGTSNRRQIGGLLPRKVTLIRWMFLAEAGRLAAGIWLVLLGLTRLA
jgi:hypothetical protein